MSIHLVRDLEQLHRDILAMCAIAEEMVHQAVHLLNRPDAKVCHSLVARDVEVDQWDVRIEDECLKMLALHQPVARDLRRITSVLKIAGELERVADLGVNIAQRAMGLVEGPAISVPKKLDRMAHVALDMLHLSIDSFVELDGKLARRVCSQDDVVDELNRDIIADLVETMQQCPELIPPGMHLFSASRHVERVADHATNIAEDVVFLVEGMIIRHQGGTNHEEEESCRARKF